MTLIDGLAIGLQATKMWIEFQEALTTKHKERQASGKELTAEDILILVRDTQSKLDANRSRILNAIADRKNAMRGLDVP